MNCIKRFFRKDNCFPDKGAFLHDEKYLSFLTKNIFFEQKFFSLYKY